MKNLQYEKLIIGLGLVLLGGVAGNSALMVKGAETVFESRIGETNQVDADVKPEPGVEVQQGKNDCEHIQ